MTPRSETCIYPYPLHVFPTRRCNFGCSYCFNDSGRGFTDRTRLVELWDDVIHQASEAGVPEIRVSGGEPLLLPRIRHMCVHVVGSGMECVLTTNGSLLQCALDWLGQVPMKTVWISLHVEHVSRREYLETVRLAAVAVPVGVNLFLRDVSTDFSLIQDVIDAGAQRVKLLRLTQLGRFRKGTVNGSESAAIRLCDWIRSRDLHRAAEIRVEAELGNHADRPGCVLSSRPLASVDHDGRVYACCLLLRQTEGLLGDLKQERLGPVLARARDSLGVVQCRRTIPPVFAGLETCPLHLTRI